MLCKSLLKINYAVDVLAKIANFIRVRALTHFVTLSLEVSVTAGFLFFYSSKRIAFHT